MSYKPHCHKSKGVFQLNADGITPNDFIWIHVILHIDIYKSFLSIQEFYTFLRVYTFLQYYSEKLIESIGQRIEID